MIKKALSLILVLIVIAGLCACGAATNTDTPKDTKPANEDKQTNAAQGGGDADTDAQTEGENDPAISEEEAVGKTEENKRIVIKYTGSGIGFTTGDGTSNHGAARQYFVFEGFKDDGTLDAVKASARVWYFFDDDASYENGIADFNDFAIKASNKTSHFFCVSAGYDSDWSSFAGIKSEVEGKSLSGIIVSDTDYELVG